ncbi:MAG: hypothetical protein ACXACD_06895, partial [Candidatus Thorarchaeota archaeon]
MRRVLVPLVIIIVMLALPAPIQNTLSTDKTQETQSAFLTDSLYTASVEGSGDQGLQVTYFSRSFTNKQLRILNSYNSPETHNGTINLENYLIPGWTLYQITIDVENLTAAPERETVGVSASPSMDFKISEYPTDNYYEQLAQGFYNQPYDGALHNYSASYFTSSYSTGLRGTAYLVIRSDHTNNTSNVTAPIEIDDHPSGFSWMTIDGGLLNLTKDAVYYGILDGRDLHEDSILFIYPTIMWGAETTAQDFNTTRYSTEFSRWSGEQAFETLLNYTYTPWNTTTNTAQTFSNPQSISLRGNSTTLSGSSWNFTSGSRNVTNLQLDSNQSIYLNHNMTLWYKKGGVTSTAWHVATSGASIEWNTTFSISYPSVSNVISKYVNLTKQSDWIISGLYNKSRPTINHDNYTLYSQRIVCSNMTSGDWILTSTAHNYITNLGTFDSFDDSTIYSNSSILVDMDINSTVEDESANPATSGTTNLTIVYSSSTIWAPSNVTVVQGTSYYNWDISSTSSNNGLYSIEVYWTNGTEAGYLRKDIVVFYPTTLTAAQTSINAYTENSFGISVYFNDTSTPQGLDGIYAALDYSFDSGSNTSMTDHGNGTWTATVPTIGKNPGAYDVNIYAEGYALQNQSMIITVMLIHETQPLTLLWSNSDNITFVEQTELTVLYRRVDGVNVTGAQVNVTIDGTTFPLIWHAASETYRLIFNGTDEPPGFGNFNLNVQAWKVGHLGQSNSSQSLTYREEPTSIVIEWSKTSDITYIETTILSVNFTMSNGTVVTDAEVNVTIDASTFILLWNGINKLYEIQFNGTDSVPGFGIHSLTISAWKFGYQNWSDTSQTLALSKEPTILEILWSNENNITFVQSTVLIANYTMSNGSAVLGATVNVTIGVDLWILVWDGLTETYRAEFSGFDIPPGFGTHGLMIRSEQVGYEGRINGTETITLREEPTSFIIGWSNSNDITFVQTTVLSVNYTMSNGSAIIAAEVNVTIGIKTWNFTWNGTSELYEIQFNGTDSIPGFGIHSLSISAWKYGYLNGSDPTQTLTMSEEPSSIVIAWSNSNNITYAEHTVLSVNYTMSNGTAIPESIVNATIGPDTWILVWHAISKTYRITFNGYDIPPGFGTHPLTIRIGKSGYQQHTDTDQELTLRIQPTLLQISWSNGNSISYLQNTILSVNYSMTNGTAVLGATVNVSIGIDTWTLVWNGTSEQYEYKFRGDDEPPGLGVHVVSIEALLNGYVTQIDNAQSLTISEEVTSILSTWNPNNNITYLESSVFSFSYLMSNTTPIPGAVVNVTIGSDVWLLVWSPGDKDYQIQFNGSDIPPGFGNHSMVVRAWKKGYVARTESSQYVKLGVEPTNSLVVQWSNSDNITYTEQTILSVNYSMADGTAISGAIVNVTIVSDTWNLFWHAASETYRIEFNGSDVPPGFGTHTLTILAWKFGYQERSNTNQELTLRIQPTAFQVSWSNTETISYVNHTILSFNYTMTNGPAVLGATVNVTIGLNTWNLTWNGLTKTYQYRFNGDDEPPGLGVHGTVIQAWRFGYAAQLDNTQTLTILKEFTTIFSLWNPDNDVTYIESTTLSVTYWMNNGTAIPGATVNVTIGTDTWPMLWNAGDKNYQIQFNGTDNPPGFALHSLFIEAGKKGYIARNVTSQTLTLRIDPTSTVIQWSNGNNLGYFDQTVLSLNYRMSSGSTIIGAIVNVTIGGTVWPMNWNSTSGLYEVSFNGSDVPPGIGTHNLTIQAWKYGFEEQEDTSQMLTLPVIPTIIQIRWSNGNNITFVENTILSVNYTMFNGTAISGAEVNATIGGDTWTLNWNSSTWIYEVRFTGGDNPPGYGPHSISIQAWRVDFADQSDNTQELTLREEPTSLEILWSNGNNITFVEQTTLRVRYLMSNGTAVQGAIVTVTIGVTVWMANWQAGSQEYQLVFSGSDDPPGLGVHSLLVQAFATGFVYASNNTETLTLTEESTNIQYTWSLPKLNNISYLEFTTLSVTYEMSDDTPIPDAIVNVTIGSTTWHMAWNGADETYEVQFFGNDDPPGFGTHNVTLKASKFGFVSVVDTTEELTIRVEDASLAFAWSNTNTITFVNDSTISVAYLLRDETPIVGATVNVTIGSDVWTAIWNVSDGTYHVIFNGTDNPPGFGTHSITISAWKLNYQGQVDSSSLTINKENTSISFAWSNGNDITYFQYTTLNVTYAMNNGTSIPGATVNVTIGSDTWMLQWDGLGEVYTIQFNGSDSKPGLGMHGLTICAEKFGYNSQVDAFQTLAISGELGAIKSEWISTGNITFIDSTVLQVNYTMSNGTAIPSATVNVTIGGTTWDLVWHIASKTYRVTFYGDDDPPGIGIHSPWIQAWRNGFDYVQDSSLTLILRKEPTSLSPSWYASKQDNISYFDYTYLFVDYLMSNGSIVTGATLNVTIGFDLWPLIWNSTEGAYAIRFNGSDLPPGLGTHVLFIQASHFGYVDATDNSQTLTLRPDPATVSVSWVSGNNFTFIEHSTLLVNYRMSNGSDILGAQLNVTIGSYSWPLVWTSTANAYSVVFNGTDDPPGLGIHSLTILASKTYFVDQIAISSVTIRTDPTTLLPSWSSETIDWTQTVNFSVSYRDSTGTLITGATQLVVRINGTQYALQGTNGTYWIEFDNTFGLGYHSIDVNVSKFGYDYAFITSIHFNILLPVNLIFDSIASQYENETVAITTQLIDTAHSTYIHWAVISLLLDESVYIMEYDSEQQEYVAHIYLGPSITPGDYVITLNAIATNCMPSSDNITLTVMAKSSFDLNIEVPIQARVGDSLVVSISLANQSQPVEGTTVIIQITWTMIDDMIDNVEELVLTNSSGQAELTISIPARAIEARIQAQYLGSIDSWPVATAEEVITIESGGSDALSLIIELLKDPVTLTLVVGTPAMSIAGLALLRRRRKSLKTTSSTIPELDTLSTGILDKVERFSISRIDPDSPIFYRLKDGKTLILSEVNKSLQETLNEVGLNSMDYTTFLEKMGIIAGIGVLGKAAISS